MKKAILVVSFGTSYLEPLKNSIENVENKIKDLFLFHNEIKNITHHNKKHKYNRKTQKR